MRAECKTRGLDIKGTKAEMEQRLIDDGWNEKTCNDVKPRKEAITAGKKKKGKA
jgi:hypothetical protein